MHFIHDKFLVYKLETSRNCKEVKHIMVMIIAIIYIHFVSDVIFDQQLKITLRKSSGLPEKIFRSPCRKGVGHCAVTINI